jgi:hypothetical protein
MGIRTKLNRLITVAVTAQALFLAACESTQEAVLPSNIDVVSVNDQYSKKGTLLPSPLTVNVEYHDRSPATGYVVRFTVIQGGGSLSRRDVATDSRGIASVDYTLGPQTGANRIRAEVTGENNISVEFTATAGDYFCTEEDPTFNVQIPPRGIFENDLLLFTSTSRLNTSGGIPVSGLVRLQLEGGFQPASYSYYESVFPITVMDCAFAQNGNFFLSWQDIFDVVVKIRPNKQSEHFADLDTPVGGEITVTPSGVLVGCDIYGPFVVGCNNTLQRFDEASFSGVGSDVANHDAVAVDINPSNAWYEDIYYIDLSDQTLRRLPVDTLVAQGDPVEVYKLTIVQAHGARGMECNDNGDVYILVDHDNEKAILKVTPTGSMTVVYDFFDRGSGTPEEAGTQRDLAIRRGPNPILYTIDTRNNSLLRVDLTQDPTHFWEYDPEAVGANPEAISTDGAIGERVGLVVIPSK